MTMVEIERLPLLRLSEEQGAGDPWASDHTLFTLAAWWVKMTRRGTPDFAAEVGIEIESLQRDLQTTRERLRAAG
jgi:hypothetical protein